MKWFKKALKISGIICAFLTVIAIAGYFYIVNNAEDLVRDFVKRQTHGKLTVDMKKIRFNVTKLRLTLVEPHFSSHDTLNDPSTFDIRVDQVTLKISALKSLIFKRKLQVDSIIFLQPHITLTKWKAMPREKFSLSEQMGNLYKSLNKVLTELSIHYCQIEKGSITLKDKLHPGRKPVTITNFSLQIDNLLIDPKSKYDKRAFLSDRIKFKSSHQDIVFPDGIHGLRYSKLRINSWKRRLELDSCYLYSRRADNGFNEFGLYLDTLRLTEVDFEALTKQGVVRADSVICINPVFGLSTVIKAKAKNNNRTVTAVSRDTLENSMKKLLGDFSIGYVGVKNAQVAILTKSGDEIIPYTVSKSNFSLDDITVIDNPAIPVHIGGFDIGVHGYRSFTPDSAYTVIFDSIHLRDDLVKLTNFSISPSIENKRNHDRKEINMQSLEIKNFSWVDLLVDRKFVASEVILDKPEINISNPGASNVKKRPEDLYQTLNKLSKRIHVGNLRITDAGVSYVSGTKTNIDLEGVNTSVRMASLLHATDVNKLAGSAKDFSFRSGTLKTAGGDVKLSGGRYFDQEKKLIISSAAYYGKDGKTIIEFTNLKAEQVQQSGEHDITAEKLGWENAKIIIRDIISKRNNSITDTADIQKLKITLHKLEGHNTSVSFASGNVKTSVYLDDLQSGTITWDGNNKPGIAGLVLNGRMLQVETLNQLLSVQQIRFADGIGAALNTFRLVSIGEKDTLTVRSPEITLNTTLQSVLENHPDINDMVIKDPVISVTRNQKISSLAVSKKKSILPDFNLSNVKLVNPVLKDFPQNGTTLVNLSNQQSNWEIRQVHSAGNKITVEGISGNMSGIAIDTKKAHIAADQHANLAFAFSGISYSPNIGSSTAKWSVTLDSLKATNIQVALKNKDSLPATINIPTAVIENISMNSDVKSDLASMVLFNKGMRIRNASVAMEISGSKIDVKGIGYEGTAQQLSLDSILYKPAKDKETFMKTSRWQDDHIEMRYGKTRVTGFNFERFFNDAVISVHKLETDKAILNISRDKRIPFREGIIKPTPVTLFGKMNKRLEIDSTILTNADITYNEFNEKTLLEGVIKLKRLNANITGLKNFGYGATDSLRIFASTWLMDSAFVRFRYIESYADTLHGFLMAVRVSPFNTTILNPVLAPLASVKIKSGWLDTVRMNVVGINYAAHGKMKMYYDNLKIQYLKNGDDDDKTLKTRLLTFVANDLILRRNNHRKTGEVYFERLPEKSFFNYWLKILISGVVSSSGLKSNKKMQRNYQQTMKKIKVPQLREVSF